MHDSVLSNPKYVRAPTWEEWMGYIVCYIHNGNEYHDPSTAYGATMSVATDKMKEFLLQGKCAWIRTIDPRKCKEIPF